MSLKRAISRDTDKDIIKIEALSYGGFSVECKNDNGLDWGGNYYGLVSYDAIQNLEGKILTIVDATFSDREQRKAMKDVFRRMVWFDWVENHIYRGKNSTSVGMLS